MINVSFSFACILYLTFTLGFVFGIWIYRLLKRREKQNLELSKLYICEYCQHAYLDDIDLQITKCPQCSLLNQKNEYTKPLES